MINCNLSAVLCLYAKTTKEYNYNSFLTTPEERSVSLFWSDRRQINITS